MILDFQCTCVYRKAMPLYSILLSSLWYILFRAQAYSGGKLLPHSDLRGGECF
jgi:hypothetical protein